MIIFRAIAVGLTVTAYCMYNWYIYFSTRFQMESGIQAYLETLNVLHRPGAEILGLHNVFLVIFTLACLAVGSLASSLYGHLETLCLNLLSQLVINTFSTAQRGITKLRVNFFARASSR